MALEAEIVIPLYEQFGVDRAVWTVTNGAAFAHGFVLEDEGLGLVAMTLGAGLVEASHRKTGGGFHDVGAVRVMALNAIHFAFKHGMMLRQVEFGVGFEMAIQTTRRVFAGVENKFPPPTAAGDVLAAGAVACFAAAWASFGVRPEMHPRVRTSGKLAHVVGVAGQAGLIAHVVASGNFCGNDDVARDG